MGVNFFIPLIICGNICYCKSHIKPTCSNIMQYLLCLYTLTKVPAITSEVIVLFPKLYVHFLFITGNPPFLFLLWPYPVPIYISWQMKSSYTFSVQNRSLAVIARGIQYLQRMKFSKGWMRICTWNCIFY